jgi:hypothetical protein
VRREERGGQRERERRGRRGAGAHCTARVDVDTSIRTLNVWGCCCCCCGAAALSGVGRRRGQDIACLAAGCAVLCDAHDGLFRAHNMDACKPCVTSAAPLRVLGTRREQRAAERRAREAGAALAPKFEPRSDSASC